MARAASPRRRFLTTLAAWGVALVIFFPVLWMILTSFKTEASAVAMPPEFLSADWTLENYAEVWARSDYPRFFWNSVFISVGSTLLGLVVAIPAAWSMATACGWLTMPGAKSGRAKCPSSGCRGTCAEGWLNNAQSQKCECPTSRVAWIASAQVNALTACASSRVCTTERAVTQRAGWLWG